MIPNHQRDAIVNALIDALKSAKRTFDALSDKMEAEMRQQEGRSDSEDDMLEDEDFICVQCRVSVRTSFRRKRRKTRDKVSRGLVS